MSAPGAFVQLPEIQRRSTTAPSWPDVPPLLARILAARGIESADELQLGLAGLPAPDGLPGLAEAVPLLLEARAAGKKVVVVGDYDADGATATALMVRGLALLGFAQPGFLVPDRFQYGYGLSPAIVELAQREAQPDVIITVDNGIASVDGVAAANAAGIPVVVTDHHLPGDTLPDAAALINPRLDDAFEGHNLAGVGVAFYLLMALRAGLRAAGDDAGGADIASLLDLVALGTVADVVVLDRPNRILVEQGVRRIRAGHCCPGITALLERANRNPQRLQAQDLGFTVAPRLNAAGRLSDMSHGIQCLLTDDPQRAAQYAEELDGINRERRQIEQGMREAAMKEVERLKQKGDLPMALTLFDDGWHEGVVGILASRVKEVAHRPVIAFAPAQDRGLIKGSGRSIIGLHMRDALDRVATAHPGLLEKFGGHAMAAGLTLARDAYPDFQAAFLEAVGEMLDPAALSPVVVTDGALDDTDISLGTAELLGTAQPWGQGFPAPQFDGEFEVLDQRVLQDRHLKLTLGLPGVSGVIDGLLFNAPVDKWPGKPGRVRGVYQLSVNEFRGRRSAQLIFQHLVPAD
ncbi:MAG: single-stranded-DNA-specific exonuclease RecJ [Alcanivoracaceae bacterium]|nr:single-stranded-DNA-specific exonuclease RecJ [Alcanivoracaceae bacterium]